MSESFESGEGLDGEVLDGEVSDGEEFTNKIPDIVESWDANLKT